jgi:hypothetical protein
MAALLELKVGLDATLGGLLVSSAERLAA